LSGLNPDGIVGREKVLGLKAGGGGDSENALMSKAESGPLEAGEWGVQRY
jgi:hypothetical protein